MDDWRKNLTDEERLEIEAEDAVLTVRHRKQRKRALDAMRMAGKRAGPAMPKWLSEEQKSEMFKFYLAAQKLSEVRGGHWQVDHIVPIRGSYTDEETGAYVHYICGLHIPKNLRVILDGHNRKRSDNLFTAEPLIVPDDDIPF